MQHTTLYYLAFVYIVAVILILLSDDWKSAAAAMAIITGILTTTLCFTRLNKIGGGKTVTGQETSADQARGDGARSEEPRGDGAGSRSDSQGSRPPTSLHRALSGAESIHDELHDGASIDGPANSGPDGYGAVTGARGDFNAPDYSPVQGFAGNAEPASGRYAPLEGRYHEQNPNTMGDAYERHHIYNSTFDAVSGATVMLGSPAELAPDVDTRNALMSGQRFQQKRSLDGLVSKTADYYAHNFADELDEVEKKPWWGNSEF